jgi:hypothetical protein
VPTLISRLLAAVTAHAQQSDSDKAGNMEILSDTKGVDFGPCLSQVLKSPRELVQLDSRSIEFARLPGGNVAGMRIVHPSGSLPLDRAGITQGNP